MNQLKKLLYAIQVNGINYLIPTRTNIKNEAKVWASIFDWI